MKHPVTTILSLAIPGFILLLHFQCLVAAPGDLAWSIQTDDLLFSSVAVSPDEKVLYVGTVIDQDPDNPGGSLVAINFDKTYANKKWQFSTGDWIESSPALSADGATLYVGSWDTNLYAVNAETGEEIWSFPTDGIIIGSPAIDAEGTIYFPSSDSFFYALNPDGTLKWDTFIGSGMDSSPAIDLDGTLYVGTLSGELVALNPDGSQKWEFVVDAAEGIDPRILSSPAITPEGNIVFGAGDGFFYSLNPDGSLNWMTPFPEELDSSPAVDPDSNIYFGSRAGDFFKFDSLGIEQWAATLGDIFFSSPVIDALGNVYMVSFSGNGESLVSAFDSEGNFLWSNTIPDVVDASPTLTPNGLLVVGAFDGKLYAFETGLNLSSGFWPKFGYALTNHQDLGRPTVPSGINRWFAYPPQMGESWHYSEWLGLLFAGELPWFHRPNWNWLYHGGPGVSQHWLYHPQLGWLWTGPEIFPHAFQSSTGEWLYVYLTEENAPWYYRFSEDPGWFQ